MTPPPHTHTPSVVAVGRKGDKGRAVGVQWNIVCTFGRGNISIEGNNDKALGKQKSQADCFICFSCKQMKAFLSLYRGKDLDRGAAAALTSAQIPIFGRLTCKSSQLFSLLPRQMNINGDPFEILGQVCVIINIDIGILVFQDAFYTFSNIAPDVPKSTDSLFPPRRAKPSTSRGMVPISKAGPETSEKGSNEVRPMLLSLTFVLYYWSAQHSGWESLNMNFGIRQAQQFESSKRERTCFHFKALLLRGQPPSSLGWRARASSSSLGGLLWEKNTLSYHLSIPEGTLCLWNLGLYDLGHFQVKHMHPVGQLHLSICPPFRFFH